jgi:hypothetical protein
LNKIIASSIVSSSAWIMMLLDGCCQHLDHISKFGELIVLIRLIITDAKIGQQREKSITWKVEVMNGCAVACAQ